MPPALPLPAFDKKDELWTKISPSTSAKETPALNELTNEQLVSFMFEHNWKVEIIPLFFPQLFHDILLMIIS